MITIVSCCLATAHPRCDRCAHQSKWLLLNQMPDSLRKAMQRRMRSIDPFECDDLDGIHFAAIGEAAA
jgi:hypothetical protein